MGQEYTYSLQDLIQWAGLLCSVLGIVWWFQRDRKAHRNDIVEITKWRTNVERDIEDLRAEVHRREKRDGMLVSKLEEMCSSVKGLGDRMLKVETLMRERARAFDNFVQGQNTDT